MSSSSYTTRSSEAKVKITTGNEEEEHENAPKKELDYPFEKELINKQNKHIHIMDTFGPSKKTPYLSTKFYARHEQSQPHNAAVTFIPFLNGTSYKHDTESNVYGWMPKSINNTKLLKELNFVSAPKRRCCLTVFGEKLDCDRENARPPFNGLRFFLQ